MDSKQNLASRLRGSAMLAIALLAITLAPCVGYSAPGVQAAWSVKQPLGLGDVVQVRLFDGLGNTEYLVQVDSRGEITLPLVNKVVVAGLTTRAVADLLTERYSTFYVRPIVDVTINAYGELRVFVFGPDYSGQMIRLPNGSRLLDLLEDPSLAPAPMNERWQETQSGHAKSGRAEPPVTLTPDPEQPQVALNPLYTRGTYRRLHLVRGEAASAHWPLLTGEPQSSIAVQQEPEGSRNSGYGQLDGRNDAVEVDTAGGPSALAEQSALSSKMNWKSWIAERQADPASQLWVIDPLRITLEGELSKFNLALEDGDVLYIPVPERFVDISGVAKPGRYELLNEESLGDLLRIAGSVEYGSDLRNTVVQRYAADGCLTRLIANIYPGLDDVAQVESFKLENRDRISILPFEERVFVLGEVNTAGAFPFVSGSTVLDYLALAGGDTEESHLAWIAVIRQDRDRLEPGAAPEVLRVNFKEVHAGYPSCEVVQPLPGDVIYVPPKGKDFEVAQVLSAVGTVINSYALIDRASTN